MMSPTVITLQSSAVATTSITMSRSVTIPIGTIFSFLVSITTTSPTWCLRINIAASNTEVLRCVVMTLRLQIAPIDIID